MITFSSHSPITIAISFLGFSRCSLICTFFVITLSYCPVDYMWERFPKNILHCTFHCENVLLFLVSDAAQCKYCQEINFYQNLNFSPHAKLIHNTVIIIPFIAYIKIPEQSCSCSSHMIAGLLHTWCNADHKTLLTLQKTWCCPQAFFPFQNF